MPQVPTKGSAVPATLEIAHLAHAMPALSPENGLMVRNLFRDGLGALLAGMRHHTVRLLAEHVRELGCAPRSPVYGWNFSTAPQEAAFVLGTATHALDFEPMCLPPTHAVSPVLGSLLALAHADPRDRDGGRFLRAFTTGIQLQVDLRRSAEAADREAVRHGRHFPFQRQGFHPPGTVGPMGSALAASIWLGLEPRQTAVALGIAASRASGIAGNIGTMTKATHCGHAARVGVESALLAQRGMTASTATFEEPAGWSEVFGGESFDIASVGDGMRSLRCFSDPGFAFKRWPVHTAMQIAICAALKAYDGARPPSQVTIHAPVFRYCDRPFPRDGDDARFSFQYNVAIGLLDGAVGLDSHSEERLRCDDVQTLLRRTKLVLDPDITPSFDGMSVHVTTDDGRRGAADGWTGHWRYPATEEDHARKFDACARRLMPPEQAQSLRSLVDGIEGDGGLETLLQGLAASEAPLAR